MSEIPRRAYLAAVGASFGVIAGCNGQSERTKTPGELTSTSETNSDDQATADDSLAVTTEPATEIDYNSAVLQGSLEGATDKDDVQKLFEWRPTNGDWTETEILESDEFEAEIEDLDSDTVYEYRAVASGAERVQGESRQFTTEPNVITFDGGGTTAFREALREASWRPGATIQFEEGMYAFDPLESYDIDDPPGPHVKATGLDEITIDGNGSTIYFTEPRMGGLHLFDSQSLTVRNLTFDYDSLPFTQGTIASFSESDRELVIELNDDYSSLNADRFGQGEVFASIHDSDGSFIDATRARGLPIKRFSSMESLGDRRWRLTLNENSTTRGISAGKRIAITARDPPGSAQALKFSNIEEPRLENVSVHASPSFAVLFANCQSPHVERVQVRPPADSNRLIGSDADGIHILNSRGGPTIVNCHVERLLDDGIIVSSLMAPVERVEGDTVFVDPIGVFAPETGDTIETMTPEGVRGGSLPAIASVTPEFEAKYGVSPAAAIEFESSVADQVQPGDYVSNAATANSEFVVSENTVRDNRANSIRISGGPGKIIDNTLHSSQNQTMNFLCDTSGTYAPERWTNDVIVEGNSVRDSGKSYLGGGGPAGVLIVHTPAEGVETTGHPHRNIDIVDNSFEDLGFRVGTIRDGRDITVQQNDVEGVNELDYPYGREAFFVDNIREIAFTKNSVSGASEYLESFGNSHDSESIRSSNNSFTLDGESQSISF